MAHDSSRFRQLLAALLMLSTLSMCLPASARRVFVTGIISNEKGNPVELATVNEERTMQSAISDLNGRYRLTVTIPDDTLRLVFRMVGHQTIRRQLIVSQDSIRLSVTLPTQSYSIGSVDVTEARRQNDGMQQISAQGIRFGADANGGSVESIIATQAGVSTHNELSNQYNVRGGNFDENSIYVNGNEIMRPLLVRAGQQEGLSFINPDMVQSIQFSTGGFDVSYADRMSSVLDITYRRPTSLEASAQASLLGGSAFIGTGNNRFSAMAGVRYKTTSYLLGTLDTKGDYDPSFFDYQTSLTWTPGRKWDFSLIANASVNNYNFKPTDRTTSFGTAEDPRKFKVYFEGWEKDRFNTATVALNATRTISDISNIRFNLSAFSSNESESYDILGEYWLEDNRSTAIGAYLQHGRNRINSKVMSASIDAKHGTQSIGSIRWGAGIRSEKIEDRMREWEYKDSAGYSLPYAGNDGISMSSSVISCGTISSNRIWAYISDSYRNQIPGGFLSVNTGVRVSHWDWNGETTISPRIIAGFTPDFNDRFTFRLSTGIYYQSPFYKEFRYVDNSSGTGMIMLNRDIRSQKSTQVILGSDYHFQMYGRPFRFTTELYYKKLDQLIPYEVDNVRLVYYGKNLSEGFAKGIDMKLFGEFVPGIDSWVTLSAMRTKELINGVWEPRPTDQRYNFSLYFSDTFPNRERWKMNLRCSFADGLPFGNGKGQLQSRKFRAPAYKRADIGLAYRILGGNSVPHYVGGRDYIRNIWLGADCLNLLGINNVCSYYWISDVTGTNYAIPNYLTGRQLNIRITVEFGKQ